MDGSSAATRLMHLVEMCNTRTRRIIKSSVDAANQANIIGLCAALSYWVQQQHWGREWLSLNLAGLIMQADISLVEHRGRVQHGLSSCH